MQKDQMDLFFVLILNFLTCWGQQVTVTQRDTFVKVQKGSAITLVCEQSDTSGAYSMLWYQQKSGKGLDLVAFSASTSDAQVEKNFLTDQNHWSMVRDNATHCLLKREKAETEDSAVYFCASPTGQKLEFGAGTILSVLGKDEKQLEPKVKIFPPNKNELKDHNLISLVCVASGFFPEHVRIYWYKNEAETLPMYQSVPQKDGSTYYTSARLSLTRSEYFNPSNSFKCAAAFVGSKNMTKSEVIAGELDCAVPKEKFGMYINEGKVYYILVFFKSFAYALIVLILIWRKKVIAGSY